MPATYTAKETLLRVLTLSYPKLKRERERERERERGNKKLNLHEEKNRGWALVVVVSFPGYSSVTHTEAKQKARLWFCSRRSLQ